MSAGLATVAARLATMVAGLTSMPAGPTSIVAGRASMAGRLASLAALPTSAWGGVAAGIISKKGCPEPRQPFLSRLVCSFWEAATG